MVRITEEVTESDAELCSDLRETLSRYRRSRRSLALVLTQIDDEVERLLLLHRSHTLRSGRKPILRVDLDVCPGPIINSHRSYFGTPRSTQAPPRWKSNSVDETLMMSQGFGDGSPDGESAPLIPAGVTELPVSSAAEDGHDTGGLLAPGCLLGDRYELIKCVGTGGSSTVYKALDRRRMTFDDVSPYVAVKVLKSRYSVVPDWLESMRREAATSQLLAHPNIVRVYEALCEGPTVCLIMEYLYGAPLTDKIRADTPIRLPQNEALRIIESMGRALAYSHKRRIVHCDFKPANIFLTHDGMVKLIDYGIAQQIVQRDENRAGEESKANDFRDLHPVTPAYASPELLERQDTDPRDDVYSLACTAYELLTGVHPFEFRSAVEARRAGLQVERREGLTRQQWKALVRALAFERSKRTPTIARFMSDFYGWTWQAQLLSKAAGTKLMSQGLAWFDRYRNPVNVDPAPHAEKPQAATEISALPSPDSISSGSAARPATDASDSK